MPIRPPAPVITSPGTATGTVGVPFTYQITATNSPTSFGAIGLPSEFSLNTATGVISGTATIDQQATVTISATNAGGTGTGTLQLAINPAGSPPPPPTVIDVLVDGVVIQTIQLDGPHEVSVRVH